MLVSLMPSQLLPPLLPTLMELLFPLSPQMLLRPGLTTSLLWPRLLLLNYISPYQIGLLRNKDNYIIKK